MSLSVVVVVVGVVGVVWVVGVVGAVGVVGVVGVVLDGVVLSTTGSYYNYPLFLVFTRELHIQWFWIVG